MPRDNRDWVRCFSSSNCNDNGRNLFLVAGSMRSSLKGKTIFRMARKHGVNCECIVVSFPDFSTCDLCFYRSNKIARHVCRGLCPARQKANCWSSPAWVHTFDAFAGSVLVRESFDMNHSLGGKVAGPASGKVYGLECKATRLRESALRDHKLIRKY